MGFCPDCQVPVEGERCPWCGRPAEPGGPFGLVGTLFADRYRLDEEERSSSGRSSCRARNETLDLPVRIEFEDAEGWSDRGGIKAFLDAAHTASRLRHPNTLRVFDFGHADGRVFEVVEDVAGTPLREVLEAEGRLEEPRLLALAEGICASLADAHAASVLHLDLRPENVLVLRNPDGSESIKVSRYGLAPTAPDISGKGRTRGVPAYISPEGVRGGPVDGRSDLYTLGTLLYEMASGMPPFHGETPVATLLMHLHDRPLRLRAAWPDAVTPGLDELVATLLAKEPERRPRGAAEVLQALQALRTPIASGDAPAAAPRTGPRRKTIQMKPILLPAEAVEAGSADTGQAPPPLPPAVEPRTPTGEARAPVAEGRPPADVPPPFPATPDLPLSDEDPRPGFAPGEVVARDRPRVARTMKWKRVRGPVDGWLIRTWRSARDAGMPILAPLLAAAVIVTLWISSASAPAGDPAAPQPRPIAAPVDPRLRPPVVVEAATAAPVARARVTSHPSGAEVFLQPGDVPLGRTPVDVFVVDREPTRIRLSTDGFRDTVLTLDYREIRASPEQHVRLSPGRGERR